MYSTFFELQENPFSPVPSVNYSYLPFSHRVILQTLGKGLSASRGLTVLFGAVGIGKSTLIQALVSDYDHNEGNIFFKDLTPQSHLQLLESSHSEMILKTFTDVVFENRNKTNTTIFLLDNFNNFDSDFLKILLNKVAENNSNNNPTLLILTGQPQFKEEINKLKPELSFPLEVKSFFLNPLEKHQVKNYINQRLLSAGLSINNLFSDDAIQRITQLSGGIPRVINNICSLSIFQASSTKSTLIDKDIVNHATEFLFTVKNKPEASIPAKPGSIQEQLLTSTIKELPNQIKILSTKPTEVESPSPLTEEPKQDSNLNEATIPKKVEIKESNPIPIETLPTKQQNFSNITVERLIPPPELTDIPSDKSVSKPIFIKRFQSIAPLFFLFAFLLFIQPQNIKQPLSFFTQSDTNSLVKTKDIKHSLAPPSFKKFLIKKSANPQFFLPLKENDVSSEEKEMSSLLQQVNKLKKHSVPHAYIRNKASHHTQQKSALNSNNLLSKTNTKNKKATLYSHSTKEQSRPYDYLSLKLHSNTLPLSVKAISLLENLPESLENNAASNQKIPYDKALISDTILGPLDITNLE